MSEICVSPMPDEIAIFHEFRRMHVLGCTSRSEHLRLLNIQCGLSDCAATPTPRLHLLARASGLSTTEYARCHSMLPVFRVASDAEHAVAYGSQVTGSLSRAHGMSSPVSETYYCPLCLKQDVSAYQFGWLHRSHQLLGVEHCVHHGVKLKKAIETGWFTEFLHWKVENFDILPIAEPADSGDEFIRRYAEIFTGFLSFSAPAIFISLKRTLRTRAALLGLRVSSCGFEKLPSDLLFEIAPSDWLKRNLRGHGYKRRGQPFGRIDRQFTWGYSRSQPGDVYAMILATLYDTADAAIAAFKSSHRC